ncbi:MAG TPA: shikimate kinase [Pyrinomonadaceae bacterium]|nr:shikimate kinase [Pyrinomonadaceae bacterium]
MNAIAPIVITGFRGCGKTKVARELARRLDAVMVDLDDQITKRAGRSPAQLIVEDGEPAFRAIETDTLRHVLQEGEAKVIALGGGAWIQEANRQLVEQYGCVSVWLDVPFEMCWTRIEASQEDRPLGRTRDQASLLYQQRRPVYELAMVHIPVGEESFENLVSRCLVHFLKHE